MVTEQPKSFMTNFTYGRTDSGFEETISESVVSTTSTTPIVKPPKDFEDKATNQDEDCCGDCNSINCPHCDCSFW